MFPIFKFGDAWNKDKKKGEKDPTPDRAMKEVFNEADKYLEKYPIEKFMRDEILQNIEDLKLELIKGSTL